MKPIIVNLPDSLEAETWEIKMLLAAMLHQQGRASGSAAALVAEVSKQTSLEMPGKFGVSVFGKSVENLEQDVRNAGGRYS